MRVRRQHRSDIAYRRRHQVLIALFMFVVIGVLVWLVDLTVLEQPFLQKQGEQRVTRRMMIPAHRGMILDAQGVPVAMSTAMFSVWVNPSEWAANRVKTHQLAKLLGHSVRWLRHRVQPSKRQFVYLKRHLTAALYAKIKHLKIKGLHVQSEFYRHYPFGPMMAQVLGFTDLEDQGQEGLELVLNKWLTGRAGVRLVEADLQGHVIGERKVLRHVQQGHNIQVTFDHQIQYIAYQHLREAVLKAHALSGSVVVIEPKTGHVLAMANYPSFDPNKVRDRAPNKVRNLAVTDTFEPGSTAKAFAAIALLRAGYQPWSKINVGRGRFAVQGHVIHDEVENLGRITLAEVLKKSSNVGIAKFALKVPVEQVIKVLDQLGLGHRTRAGFSGEAMGRLRQHIKGGGFDHAALAYGYGVSLTHLQLAHAYAIIANDGVDPGVHFIQDSRGPVQRVIQHNVVKKLVKMLTGVTAKDGSGHRARVSGIQVAGKTGTALIASSQGYQAGRVNVSFVGIAPAQHPRLVVSVMIHQPGPGYRFGGVAAAPVFSKVVADSLLHLK